jgi:hypothetical protein
MIRVTERIHADRYQEVRCVAPKAEKVKVTAPAVVLIRCREPKAIMATLTV